jgi:hypothetical protein
MVIDFNQEPHQIHIFQKYYSVVPMFPKGLLVTAKLHRLEQVAYFFTS